MSRTVRRLLAGFAPKHYTLTLDPDRDTMHVTGTVQIDGQKIGRPSQRITFHQKYLKVTSATIAKHDKKGDVDIAVVRINHQKTLDEVRLHTETLLYPGTYSVTMHFEGPVQDSMHGIYVCNYEVDGKKKKVISTQFESHSAREAFPCIDEPAAKATFELTLLSPKNEVSISNMPAASQTQSGDKLSTTFETTPKMSTYLLAFAYGDLQSKSTKTKDGVEATVWATKAHKPESLEFAVEVARRALEFFNGYYGVPYPLTKCDHVAVPDFAVGAMENWGIITYRETCLVIDPAAASQSGRERIALVVSHELSHQWFGDLVTMKWWDDLWLNESFANVMEYVALNALFPEWDVWNDFVAQEGLSAIRRDCIAGVQSVYVKVNHPDEISSLFDHSIVYAKGGRLLNMLMNYVGEASFRSALKQYFTRYVYANTAGSNLWEALSESSGKDIAAFMNPWLTRSGFPLVEVTQNGRQLELRQSHFLLDAKKADPDRVWSVPLLGGNSDLPDLLDSSHLDVTLEADEFVHINRGAVGHYIVQYTVPEHAETLARQAEAKELTVAERLMLLHDSSLLARAGKQSFADTLTLLQHYKREDSEPVWDIMALVLADCRRFVDIDLALEEPIKALIRELIIPQYTRLGWDERPDESSHDIKLRATIIGLGIYSEHAQILQEAVKRFEAYKKKPESVPSELRGVVLAAAIRAGAQGAFKYLLQLDSETHDAQLKHDILGALTATKSPEEAKVLLGRLKDTDKVRAQDVDYWLEDLLQNRYSREVAWRWFRDNWGWIEETFGHDQTYDDFPRDAAGAFSTAKSLAEYKAFFESKTNQPPLARNIAMGIEEIENRLDWLQQDLPRIKTFFSL
jgi:aminopeptidase N